MILIFIIKILVIILLITYIAVACMFLWVFNPLSRRKKALNIKRTPEGEVETIEIDIEKTPSTKGSRVISPLKQRKERELMEEITS